MMLFGVHDSYMSLFVIISTMLNLIKMHLLFEIPLEKHLAVCLYMDVILFYQVKNAMEKALCFIGATNYAELGIVYKF